MQKKLNLLIFILVVITLMYCKSVSEKERRLLINIESAIEKTKTAPQDSILDERLAHRLILEAAKEDIERGINLKDSTNQKLEAIINIYK